MVLSNMLAKCFQNVENISWGFGFLPLKLIQGSQGILYRNGGEAISGSKSLGEVVASVRNHLCLLAFPFPSLPQSCPCLDISHLQAFSTTAAGGDKRKKEQQGAS